jgi:hypothetical protein
MQRNIKRNTDQKKIQKAAKKRALAERNKKKSLPTTLKRRIGYSTQSQTNIVETQDEVGQAEVEAA